MTPRAFAIAAAVLTLAALRPAAAAAQSATITGRVTAQGTDAPLPDSRVLITGTSIVTTTSADGRYTLRGVPAGVADVRVLRVGYQEQKRSLTVAAGQSVTADFTMTAAIVNLAEVVTTATGEQRRVEIGNSVSTIDAAQRTQETPLSDIGTLLIGQAPGVQVQTSNTLGVGARIRIRGVNSLSLTNDPIYIVDGVRVTSSNGSLSGNIFTGGAAESRANDINPDEIETVEIVKGPSAATLYGTDAANGVIVITTKRGRAGAAQYHVFGESGVSHDFNTYPTAYTLVGKAPGATVEKQCFLTQISLGTCVADSLRSFNLFADPNTTPLHNGYRQNGGLQVSGGSDAVRFFTSGEL
ncbi:MAG TPA: TonB-dependent receptor plug domain-containing protein, partial [Gemmatimonadaceae bacterium]